MRTSITVKFIAPGFHRWKHAPASRAYLAQPHRHLFHVSVGMSVEHHDREVEFHDLLDYAKAQSAFSDGEILSQHPETNPYIDWSCEHHAEKIMAALCGCYPNRRISVTVSEDDECGATIYNT